MKLIGSAAAMTVLPATTISADDAAAKVAPRPELLALRDQVQKLVDDFKLDQVLRDYPTQYSHIYRHHRARIDSCPECDARLEDGITEMSHSHGATGGAASQRFIRYIAHKPVDLGFGIMLREDTHWHPEIEVPLTLKYLVDAFIIQREFDAADIFNNGRTYDPTVGADGVAMFSEHHPFDAGTWSNILPMAGGPPDSRLILEACIHTGTRLVNDVGARFGARGKQVVVPVALMAYAERATKTELRPGTADSDAAAIREMPPGLSPYFTWDYLSDNDNWFVRTDVDGLIWSERDPLAFRVDIDPKTNSVLVLGHEKRGFGCADPRAVVGVFGSRPSA